jgi:hypothetical protein
VKSGLGIDYTPQDAEDHGGAVDYLARHRLSSRPCRFDVVAIDRPREGTPQVTVRANAFDDA